MKVTALRGERSISWVDGIVDTQCEEIAAQASDQQAPAIVVAQNRKAIAHHRGL